MWVGTNTGGLARFDRASGRFDVLRHDPADPTSLSHDSVYAIAESPDGSLWVGTQEGLNRLDPRSGRFERLSADASDASALPHDYVYALKLDRQGRRWIATVGGGVAWIDPATRGITRVPFAREPAAPEPDRLMFAVAEDSLLTRTRCFWIECDWLPRRKSNQNFLTPGEPGGFPGGSR